MYRKSQKFINTLFDKCELSHNDINKLCTLSKSRNNEIRSDVAILLGRISDKKSERVLYSLSFDKDEIVKIEAVDSLAMGSSLLVVQRLKQVCLSESSYLRFYGIQSYCDAFFNLHQFETKMKKEMLTTLKTFERIEKDKFVLASIYKCEAICGDLDATFKLIQMHKFAKEKQNFHLITPILNLLIELKEHVDDKTIEEVVITYVNEEEKI